MYIKNKNKKMEENTNELEINNLNELGSHLKKAIDNSPNKPSEEEIEKAKIAYEEAAKNFPVKSWDICEPEKAMSFLDYLFHFIRNRIFWTKNGWMGVIKMNEELKDAENFIKLNINKGATLKLGYQALEFMFYSLQNPGGTGLQSCQDFESENEIYAEIFDAIGKNVAEARDELKHIQFLQDQYAAMQQGFYLEIEPPATENTENTEVKEEIDN